MDSLSSIKSAQLNGIMNQYEIPATMRKDGTMRKARRVKPGFVPQEEVPLYQAKGKRTMAQNSPYPPGWHPATSSAPSKKVEKTKVKTETEKQQKPPQPKPHQPAPEKPKPKDKKEATKQATSNKVKEVDKISEKLQELDIDPTIEVSKRLKRLRRKLREAEILEEKIKTGELDAPEKDQLIKLENRRKFEEEIEQLEEEREQLRELKKTCN